MDGIGSILLLVAFLSAIFSVFFSRSSHLAWTRYVNTACQGMALVLACYHFYGVFVQGASYVKIFAPWIQCQAVISHWAIRGDPLSALMLFVIYAVTVSVYLYSLWYLRSDGRINLFFCYLSLFVLCMSLLVVSEDLLQLFLGWEGVGLCSYLLIGFWYQKESASAASLKAFLMNRVGDLGLLLAIAVLYRFFGTITISELMTILSEAPKQQLVLFGGSVPVLTVVGLCLLFACTGKSAQVVLYGWLPDAMEGPTPASALIHAATMVTAGVFLVVRFSFVYEYSEVARVAVLCVGLTTAILTALSALLQTDIKRVVAYSTCSQLGYMLCACGLSAYPSAMFHLLTHAFFKSLLFLGAGSIIHAASGQQDIRKVRGMRCLLPLTYRMMFVATVSISGIFPFAGFYSKEEIIQMAYLSQSSFSVLVYVGLLFVSFLTAAYTWRLFFTVFHGKSFHVKREPERWLPVFAMIFMALGAVFAGVVGHDFLHLAGKMSVSRWQGILDLAVYQSLFMREGSIVFEQILPVSMSILGIGFAYLLVFRGRGLLETDSALYRLVRQGWHFDWIYGQIEKGTRAFAAVLSREVDAFFVHGTLVQGLVRVSSGLSGLLGVLHSGKVYRYALLACAVLTMMLVYILLGFEGRL